MIERRAAAKVNLALTVTGRRTDGYHVLESLVVFCQAGDRLTFERAEDDDLAICGPFADKVGKTGNLVARARDALRAEVTTEGGEAPPVAITLEKNLPVASGIGGGSADAAATLRGLARLWNVERQDLVGLAGALGADVPMCLIGAPLIAGGIGEKLAPVSPFPALDLVLVNPGVPVSTTAVFAELEHSEQPPLGVLPQMTVPDDLLAVLTTSRNDLEAPAMRLAPEIGDALRAIRDAGAALARMSGSGATCFGLFENAEAAAGAASKLQAKAPGWYVRATKTFAG